VKGLLAKEGKNLLSTILPVYGKRCSCLGEILAGHTPRMWPEGIIKERERSLTTTRKEIVQLSDFTKKKETKERRNTKPKNTTPNPKQKE